MSSHTAWASEIARKLLEVPLPRRWAHTRGVAAQARGLALVLGDELELLEASAWLHDIGYSPYLVSSGFHPLDGARYLRDVEHADDILCRLVANHSCAAIEAEERGLAETLESEFPLPDSALQSALTYCDMTTSPDGHTVTIGRRLAEICERYGPGHLVTRFIRQAQPHLVDAVQDVQGRLLQVSLDR
ncbi:HD domain-containing protein [Actinomadura alba]|uniref:HD domain-containing protein n=1 Tax=Actinomadura alba TaxID=406431 RepID=A0ABR7M246_9ACTN|nr:HD domain-containing protein [Actinomadura alba]MBC6470879.1 HD domain-containing protein [Actinomadura alba]